MLADQAQITRLDLPAFGQHQPAPHTVGQFAHIARPVMFAHGNQRILAETAWAATGFMAVEVRKMVGQHRQITVTLTQRRGDHLQAR